MAQMFSYLVGILIAGLIVFGLHFGMQVGSPAYARQVEAERAAGKGLDELEKDLNSRDLNKQIAAVTAIGQGDDELDRRVKLLAQATASNDRSIRSICTLSVQRMGDRVKPTVRKLLDSKTPEDVRSACGIIFAMGANGDEFAPDMFKMLEEGDEFDRHAAIYALQNMSPETTVKQVGLIARELDDTDFNTQCIACAVLRRMGAGAEPATPRLVKLLQEGNVSSRSRAAQALAAIGPVEGFDIPALIATQLDAFSYMEKARALDAIGELGPAASGYLEKVHMLMTTVKYNCICEAALAHYLISGEAQPSLRILMDEASRPRNRQIAIECLGGMKEDAFDAVPVLIEHLGSNDDAIAETAALALKNIGPTAEAALPRLKKMLGHDDFLMSVAVQEAIDSISGKTEEK